jgi:DNA invertase Pin-like site-specific DNA recombinase
MADERNTRTAAIYGRVSRIVNGRGERSPQQQEAEARKACEANGWPIGAVYLDPDRSASRFATKARERFRELVADLATGRYGVLVLWESSRGSRELEEWARLLNTCREHDVLVHVVSHGRTYNMRNGRDWRSLAEDGVDSQYESEKTSARIRRDMAASAKAGRPHGKVKYGYSRRYHPETRELVAQEVDPETAPIVRRIFANVVEGVPISTIVRQLNAEGIKSPTGKAWTRNVVRNMALSPTYIGKRRHNGGGELHDGTWPALVDEPTYWSAVRVLTDQRRKTTRPGRAKYLLSYVARSECGGHLSAARGREYYACEADGCVNIKMDWLDTYVTRIVLGVLSRPDEYAALAKADDSAVMAARAEADQLRTRLDEFYDSAASGELTPAALARVEARLLPQIEAADRRAVEAATPPVLRRLLDGPAADMADRWESMPMAARREVVDLVAAVVVRKAKPGTHTYDDLPDRVDVTPKGPS